MLKTLLGIGATKLVDSVGNTSLKLRTALTGDMPPDVKVQLADIAADLDKAVIENQSKLNLADASKGLFFAGWRASLGWVCAVGVGSYFLPKHILGAYVWVSQFAATGKVAAYPIDADGILELTAALLGLGVLRTVEKYQKTNTKH